MTITRTASPVSVSPEASTPSRSHRRLYLLLLVGVTVLALAVVAGWTFVGNASRPAQPAVVSVLEPLSPYDEGGSVYSEQVPPEAGADPYAPGGSVYSEQVPGQATETANPYAVGGSVYSEQVPGQATETANPYAVGGSVYSEQVPAAATAQ